MKPAPLADLVAVYKSLAHPARLRILAMLRGGELCVCQITAVLGLATSTVSAHLAELRRAGLVSERKDGRWVAYSLAEGEAPHRALEHVRATLESDPRVRADAELLRSLRRIPLEEVCRAESDLERLGIRPPAPAGRVGTR